MAPGVEAVRHRTEHRNRDRTATIESVYRHEIRPALTQGAEVMDKIFG